LAIFTKYDEETQTNYWFFQGRITADNMLENLQQIDPEIYQPGVAVIVIHHPNTSYDEGLFTRTSEIMDSLKSRESQNRPAQYKVGNLCTDEQLSDYPGMWNVVSEAREDMRKMQSNRAFSSLKELCLWLERDPDQVLSFLTEWISENNQSNTGWLPKLSDN